MMEIPLWLGLAVAFCTAAAAGFGASQWSSARRVAALGAQLGKADKARQLALVQTAQTRKQIERLQAELSTQQRDMAERIRAAQQRVDQLQQVLAHGDNPGEQRPEVSVHSFADTQPMEAAARV
jgi:phage-related tail protein